MLKNKFFLKHLSQYMKFSKKIIVGYALMAIIAIGLLVVVPFVQNYESRRDRWERTTKYSLQKMLHDNDDLKNYEIKVKDVTLLKISKNTYEGTATVYTSTPYKEYKISLTLITDGKRYRVKADFSTLILKLTYEEDHGNDKAVIANSANEMELHSKLDPRLIGEWESISGNGMIDWLFFQSDKTITGKTDLFDLDDEQFNGTWYTNENKIFINTLNKTKPGEYKFRHSYPNSSLVLCINTDGSSACFHPCGKIEPCYYKKFLGGE